MPQGKSRVFGPYGVDIPLYAGSSLKPSGERIAHAGHEQAGRTLRDYLGIDEDQVRISGASVVTSKLAIEGHLKTGHRAAART